MTRLLTAALLGLTLPSVAGSPLSVYVDGLYLGTLAHPGLEYHLGAGELHITTRETVIGCTNDTILWDRFEAKEES